MIWRLSQHPFRQLSGAVFSTHLDDTHGHAGADQGDDKLKLPHGGDMRKFG
jgi:hypothetical protein